MERIMKYLNRVYRASVLDRQLAFADFGLAGPQLSYILQICRNPGRTQEELAASLFVHKSSVARQVARLEKNAFLTRAADPRDLRRRLLYPTDKAKAIYPRIIDYLEAWNEVLIAGLSPEDCQKLLSLCRHLAQTSTRHVKAQDITELLGKEWDN